MLLNIYLGTTITSWVVNVIFGKAVQKKLSREGYRSVKDDRSIQEKIVNWMSIALKLSIPVYNIANAIVILCMLDKAYLCVEEELLKNGKIYKTNEKAINSDLEDAISNQNENDNVKETAEQKTKLYNEMTNEEKISFLQNEREKLLKQLETQKTREPREPKIYPPLRK